MNRTQVFIHRKTFGHSCLTFLMSWGKMALHSLLLWSLFCLRTNLWKPKCTKWCKWNSWQEALILPENWIYNISFLEHHYPKKIFNNPDLIRYPFLAVNLKTHITNKWRNIIHYFFLKKKGSFCSSNHY